MTSPKKPSDAWKSIALLGAQLSRVWGNEFIAGVLETAQANDVNVVCFIGGKPLAISATAGASSSYGFYDLVKPGQFDGILLAADLGHGLTPEEINRFSRSFTPLPIVSIALQAHDVPTLIADGEGGMRAMIRHLIDVHGYKRIAFIRGPRGQMEADQRFAAYQAELKVHHIRYEDILVVDGDFTPESGRAAIHTLVDQRGIRFQAIAASNDRMAFGAMEALQQRGIQVPDSVALTGFDDVTEAQSLGVPLTTVRQSFYDAGKMAFNVLMRRMSGEEVDLISTLPAELVVRWSCGCLPESVKQAVVLPKEVAHTGRLENKRDAAIRALFGAAGIPEDDPAKAQYRDVFGRTWDVFLASLGETDTSDAFMKMTQTTVEVLQRHGHETTTWHNIISTFRKYALGGITDHTIMLRAENLFQQARMLVGELSQRAQAIRRLQFEQQEGALGNFSFSMAPAMSLEEIGEAITRNFTALGVEHWYVMFYSDVSSPKSISSPPPESYRLLMQFENGRLHIPLERSTLATGRLVPQGKTPEDHRYSAVVMPLTLASNRFGFMWTEVGPGDWDVYVRVRNLLSSALLRTMLVQQRELAQKEVERLLSEARERAVDLARARDLAEKAAVQNAKLFESEKTRRRGAEVLARSARQLSLLTTLERLPQQILDQLQQVLPCERAVLFMEDVNGQPEIRSHKGLPENAPVEEFHLKFGNADFYQTIVRRGETLIISDVNTTKGWVQPEWLPRDHSWPHSFIYKKVTSYSLKYEVAQNI